MDYQTVKSILDSCNRNIASIGSDLFWQLSDEEINKIPLLGMNQLEYETINNFAICFSVQNSKEELINVFYCGGEPFRVINKNQPTP